MFNKHALLRVSIFSKQRRSSKSQYFEDRYIHGFCLLFIDRAGEVVAFYIRSAKAVRKGICSYNNHFGRHSKSTS